MEGSQFFELVLYTPVNNYVMANLNTIIPNLHL